MNPYWLILGFNVLVQLVMFLRWLHRRMRDDEIQRAFLDDVASNHLPRIYNALALIANHLQIKLEEPPPVRFFDVSYSDRRRNPR